MLKFEKKKFPKISDAIIWKISFPREVILKSNKGIFIGPQVRELI